ncbi:hypothetical protein PIROE2DRAFT_63098 [Piromyces sp. E2]|nr:hypothetical protein PIROE2DRAFT_63098 [Piromyces sp. E2]|eukprot:OUM60514.1 hypothetical protein PIROE2DRAFT_63098 [Piromyces sp. E2]
MNDNKSNNDDNGNNKNCIGNNENYGNHHPIEKEIKNDSSSIKENLKLEEVPLQLHESNEEEEEEEENTFINMENISEESYSEIHISCINENIDIIEILINCGYDINDRCGDGSTPLLLSIKQNKWKAVQFLLEKEADLTIPDNNGDTPVSYVLKHLSEKKNNKLLEILLPYINMNQKYPPEEWTPLKYLVKGNNPEALHIISNIDGFNIDEKDSEGNSLLIFTIKEYPEKLTMIESILSHGADVNQLDSENKIPLIHAIEKENIDLIRLLIKYNADVTCTMPNGYTPIKYACIKNNTNNTNIVNELLKVLKKS